MRASMILARAIRKFRLLGKLKRNRKMGIFQATLYLESIPGDHEKIRKHQHVEVFGEFTENNPWGHKIKCVYDEGFKCFKADVEIKVGQQFKFIIDHGKRYIPSGRYPLSRDGNQNNVYDPNGVQWSKNERKSYKHGQGQNLYQLAQKPKQKK